jgi:signal transduction histidine kinase
VERLAAGLSHELNNPAAVVVRAACELEGVIDELVHNAFAWRSSAGEHERLALAAVIKSIGTVPHVETNAGSIETFDEILDWAEAHGVCKADVIADNLIQIGMTSESLESMLSGIGKPILPMALDLVCTTLEVRQLVGDLREAGARISSLVSATSIYADLDRAPERLFSVTDGIDATLAMIPQRLVGIQIVRDYAEDIPEILGNARELNEVWTNLIENALDAMMGSGTLTLHARHEAGCVEVEVTDTGPGILEESVEHIFEPFYTTKDVGKGTGLGLHMCHRIVTRSHGGSMAVRSVPGKTTFLVRLPVAGRSGVWGDSAVAEMPK